MAFPSPNFCNSASSPVDSRMISKTYHNPRAWPIRGVSVSFVAWYSHSTSRRGGGVAQHSSPTGRLLSGLAGAGSTPARSTDSSHHDACESATLESPVLSTLGDFDSLTSQRMEKRRGHAAHWCYATSHVRAIRMSASRLSFFYACSYPQGQSHLKSEGNGRTQN